ncbi:unnamed protein product [Blepharisma stoltei]|uniref:Uncharacterized protein n=1 Tax=Blepharisma stoltei TaxID=1481888 RepID=A0AAU9K2T7_9CILI|nr:unnamed protein product [Blepharisma stoltei]
MSNWNEHKYELCEDTARNKFLDCYYNWARLNDFWLKKSNVQVSFAIVIIGVFGILSTGRILIYFSFYLSPGFRIILRLMYAYLRDLDPSRLEA